MLINLNRNSLTSIHPRYKFRILLHFHSYCNSQQCFPYLY